ncbi:MAG: class I adenylate-forming enzyme family protein, partial [Desulfomonilia bacterium]|nr:class I adenylate-forming enzyme family protein [Desulfomonilia bacterium]
MLQRDQQNLYSIPFCTSLKNQGIARKDRVAIIDGQSGESITYGDLYCRVSRMASWLSRRGIDFGDRVACLSLNSKAYIEFMYALAWIGAVAVPLNIRLNPKELSYIVRDSGAKAIFSCAFFVGVADQVVQDNPSIELKILSAEKQGEWSAISELTDEVNDHSAVSEKVSGETLFMLLYTSGTTGKPKGCMIPQRVWTGYAMHMAACFQMASQD